MQNRDFRAKQFMPFEALRGFSDERLDVEKIIIDKSILCEDNIEFINRKICNLKKGDNVNIKYYYDFNYINTKGIIKKIDVFNSKIYILDTIIDFENIIDIEVLI